MWKGQRSLVFNRSSNLKSFKHFSIFCQRKVFSGLLGHFSFCLPFFISWVAKVIHQLLSRKKIPSNLGLTWCLPCVTIAKEGTTSPSSVSGSSSTSGSCKSGSTVIKSNNISTSNSVIQIKRSGSLSSNCSHALQCNGLQNGSISGLKPTSAGNDPLKPGSDPHKPGNDLQQRLRPCIKHPKNGLSYSYDDLLSVSNSSSAGTTYGFVRRPALKRSSSITMNGGIKNRTHPVSGKSGNHNPAGYSTNSLCSNKSVKFNLPLNQTSNGEITSTTSEMTEKKFMTNSMSYFFTGPGFSGIPPGNYFMYQNYCNNCGHCPFSGNSIQLAPMTNFQLATWFQTQNFYHQYPHQAQEITDTGFWKKFRQIIFFSNLACEILISSYLFFC